MSDKTNNPTENVEIDQENIKPGVKMVSKKGQKAKGVDKVSVIHVAESVTSPEKAEQPEKVEESVIPEDDKMEDDKKNESHDKEMSLSEDDDVERSVNGSTVDDEEDKESVADESAGNQKERMESTIQQMLDSMGTLESPEKIRHYIEKYKLLKIVDGLPKSLYGVKLEEAGSASMAHQIVMHSMLISLNKQVGSMMSENSLAADQVKSIHDMLKTIHDSQKEGLEEWKKATVAEAKKWRQEAKQEAMKKESAQDNEIARLQKMLQELINDRLTSAVQKKEEESASAASQRKRTSEEAALNKPDSKWVKKDASEASSSTPEEKYRAALAKRKRVTFSCTLCVSNDHKTAACGNFGTIKARTQRMAELGLCNTCGRSHAENCRFTTSKPCEICGASHLTHLCTRTFE